MAKLDRVFQKLFGSSMPTSDCGKFGSLAEGSPATTKDPSLIQSLVEFLEGWASATVGTLEPAYQDMNAIHYLAFYQLCYLFQMGIAEYDASTIYYLNSIVQDSNGILYTSLQNNNTGNTPASSPTYWQVGLVGSESPGIIKAYAGSVAPAGYIICDGSAISRSTYAALYAICGIAYGPGNGTTTFNIPDLRTRIPVGYKLSDDTFGTLGLTPGAKTVNLQHNHGGLTGGVQFGGPGSLTAFNLDEPHQHPINNDLSAAQSIIQPSLVINYIIKT